ncbi:MAG: hypothetical protein KC933_09735 [Myxococcales bacterium]|nr:hypothetical protein [Myxococcales bacterium]MCB9647150.1 hypothetical protein [Deltaproteobacteria bacterium]
MTRRAAPLLVLGLLLTMACSTDPGGGLGDGGVDAGAQQTPEKHRTTAVACDDVRNVPDVPAGGTPIGSTCGSHDDCTDGRNGRCVDVNRGLYTCTYDACLQDSDCEHVCECEGGFGSDHNICLQTGNCNVDADCGAGGFCSPSYGDCGDYSGTVAYYCHTAQDECVDDADCGGYPWYCGYDPVGGRWRCSDSHCAG